MPPCLRYYNMRKIILLLPILFLIVGCIEDGFTSSPSDQPVFSVDTLAFGTVFTDQVTTTQSFTVRNPHAKQLSIADISLSGPAADYFRLNVDGIPGRQFSGVDVRGKDSIYVFVEATLPEGPSRSTDYTAYVNFTTNGVTRSVVLDAQGLNVRRLRGEVLAEDTRFDAELPYQIFDSLVVAPGATLTIAPGTELLFHDKAMLIVRGRLVAEGTVDEPINMTGDRTGNVVGDVSFDLISRQWIGAFITPTSTGNVMRHVSMRNTWQGLIVEGNPYSAGTQLRLENCRLRNSGGLVLEAYHSNIEAVGCEFAEASEGLLYLQGGSCNFNHCTFANYYLFTVVSGPALQFGHVSGDEKTGLDDGSGLPYTSARVVNSIIYGYGGELSHPDLAGTEIEIRRTLLKSAGEDDEHFIECIWDTDPLFYTVRSEYLFDYRVKEDSPAIEAGITSDAPADWYGTPRRATLGAYEYTPELPQ